MSIPSISFKSNKQPSHAHHHRQNGSGTRTRSSSTSTRSRRAAPARTEFSSEDSDLDDLPEIKTSPKHTSAMMALASSDSDSPVAEEDQEVEVKEVNWGSRKRPPGARSRSGGHGQHRHRHRSPQVQEPEEEEEEADPPSRGRQRRSQSMRSGSRSGRSRRSETFTYNVVKENKKLIKKHGAEYRLMENDSAVLFANTMKDEDKAIAIVKKVALTPNDPVPDPIAIIRRQHRGKRATISDPQLEKPYDDRPAEVLGMCYVHLPDCKTKMKTFRVAIPTAPANYPITDERELARIAEIGEPRDDVYQYVTAVPSIGPDGEPVNLFGNVYKLESTKNYVVRDDRGKTVFVIYKVAEGSYNIKARHPLTPVTAFGLAIAIIGSE